MPIAATRAGTCKLPRRVGEGGGPAPPPPGPKGPATGPADSRRSERHFPVVGPRRVSDSVPRSAIARRTRLSLDHGAVAEGRGRPHFRDRSLRPLLPVGFPAFRAERRNTGVADALGAAREQACPATAVRRPSTS